MSESPPPSHPARVWVPALALLAVATAALTLPTLRDLDTHRPFPEQLLARHGGVLVANDTVAFAWHVENFAARFDHSARAAFDPDVYFPYPEFDCPISYLLPCGLLKWATDWPGVRIINLFTIAIVFFNGVAAFGFLRAIGAAGPVAVAAAVGYMAPNFVLYSQHMGHMNYVQIQWIALAFWALVAACRPGAGWLPAIGLGLAMGFQLLSSPSFSLYLAYVGLPVFAITHWLASPRDARPRLLPLALRGLVAVVVALAIAVAYLHPRIGSAPKSFQVPGPSFTWTSFSEFLDPGHPVLFVGTPLAVLGVLAVGWWWRNRTPLGTAMVATLVAATVCMLPAVPGTPYWLLREYAPLFDRMRIPIRFFPIAFLMLLGLVAAFLTACAEGKRPRAQWGYAILLILALAVGHWFASPWLYEIKIEQPIGVN